MANTTTYDGPPSLKIYQEFVRSASSGTIDQNVVVVAPQYDVYTHNDETVARTEYVRGTAYSDTWGAGVDYDNAKLYLENAACTMGTHSVAVTTDDGNCIDFGSVDVTVPNVDAGIYEAAAVGDKVLVTGGSSDVIAEITALARGTSSSSHDTDFTALSGNTGTGGFTVTTGTYSGDSDCLYYLKVDDSIDMSDSDSESTTPALTCTVTTSDGHDAGVVVFNGPDAVAALASSGLVVGLKLTGGSSYVAGDYYQLHVTPAGEGKVSLVYLDKVITGATTSTPLTARICKYREFYLDADQYTSTASGISTSSNIEQVVTFGVTSPAEYTAQVVTADIIVEYRQLNTKYVNKLGYVDYTDDLTEIGSTSVSNPLGAMVSAALKGGKGVYFVGVTDDSVAAYRKAFIILSKSPTAYGLVIGSVRQDVVAEAMTFCQQQSDPSVVNYKILYYGLPSDPDVEILGKTDSSAYVTATVEDGVVTAVTSGVDFVAAGVRIGDAFRTNYGKKSDGTMSYDTYYVRSITGTGTVVLTNTAVNIPVAAKFEIWRTLEGSELVDALKSRVYTTNHRAYCVFGDGINVDGIEDAPAWLKAALPAGMRAGDYCQRPISNLAYDGCTASPTLGLSAADRVSLASRGVWILASNDDGSQVYNYHQLSTDMSDKKLQEQSYTTNFDNISSGAKALFAQMRTHLNAYLTDKTRNAPSVSVGPQLISYSNLSITQDSVNKDHVYMEVDYDMPAPFNHVTLRQRLI